MADEQTDDPRKPGMRRPRSDAELVDATPRYSPVCTFCYWWKPADGHYCGAWPPGGKMKVPSNIWSGASSHMYPIGSEKRDGKGQPIVFRLHPDANRENLPEKLAKDLAAREAKEKDSK